MLARVEKIARQDVQVVKHGSVVVRQWATTISMHLTVALMLSTDTITAKFSHVKTLVTNWSVFLTITLFYYATKNFWSVTS